MHCGVHCRLFHWFLGKCFSVEVHPYMTCFCTCWQSAFSITLIAERSEANNRVLWAQQSQLAFISIYTYIRTAKHMFKMASLAVFWVPSSKSWRAQSQRSGQICHEVLSRETYYSSQVCRVCVALL